MFDWLFGKTNTSVYTLPNPVRVSEPPPAIRPQIAELVAHIRDWQHGWVVKCDYNYGLITDTWTWYDVTVTVRTTEYYTGVTLTDPAGGVALNDVEKKAVKEAFAARKKYSLEKAANKQLEELSRRLNRDVAISP